MEEIENIVEKISFTKKDSFSNFLAKCIKPYINKDESDRESQRTFRSIIFSIDVFFKNFSPFINERGADKKYEAGVEALYLISEEIKLNLDESECFILFHLRDLGKFRIKQSKLYEELQKVWGQYKHYRLDEQDLSAALRVMRKNKIIEYRRGNLQLATSVIIRYR